MSYILDALRRADAERERGEVPSLHSQQYGALPGDDDTPEPPRLLIGTIVVLVLALGGALAWNFWGRSDRASHLTTPGTVSALPPAAPTAPSAPTIAALPPSSTAPATMPAATASTPAIATARVAPDARRRLNAAAAPDRRRATHTAPASASPPETASGSGKLPDALRRELPTLAFGGASYSKDAASRMVIFNGRVFHEGDTIAPQLVLEQIKLKAAVFTYKGYRYEIDY